MASPTRQTPDTLIAELAARPFAFDFFRAIRLLENARPDLPRIGYSIGPAQDPVRFGQKPSMGFPSSTLEALEPRPEGPAPKLYVRNFGLFGPNGPLPLQLTEYAFQREYNERDPTLAAFADVFHHRLVSFFYRAWADCQKAVDLDRPEEQRFAIFLGSLFGVGMEALQNHDPVPDPAKLYFTGRLACQTRNAEGLQAILGDFFQVKSEIISFIGRWMNLPADSVCQLGRSRQAGRLGLDVVVGSRFFNAQLNFRIRLGPMSLADYERMLPSGSAFQRLKNWVLNYCGEHFFWEVQLVLRAEEVPATKLGAFGSLGWTTWLKSIPFTRDAEDLVLCAPEIRCE